MIVDKENIGFDLCFEQIESSDLTGMVEILEKNNIPGFINDDILAAYDQLFNGISGLIHNDEGWNLYYKPRPEGFSFRFFYDVEEKTCFY